MRLERLAARIRKNRFHPRLPQHSEAKWRLNRAKWHTLGVPAVAHRISERPRHLSVPPAARCALLGEANLHCDGALSGTPCTSDCPRRIEPQLWGGPLTFVGGSKGPMRRAAPPCGCTFAARTDPLASPLAVECGLTPEALAKFGRGIGGLIAWRLCRWGIDHECSFARSHSRVRSSSA